MDLPEIGCDGVDRRDLALDGEKLRCCCEYGDEHSGSVKCGDFLKFLRSYWLLNADSAPCSC
jgi:hypothetical protein